MKGYKEGMIMSDTVEVIGEGSLIQHGAHNDRIYLMKLFKQLLETIKKILKVL